MTTIRVAILACLCTILASTVAAAKVSVYLKDGSRIETKSAWREGSTVYALVNRDTLVDFSEAEVDLQKSKLKVRPGKSLLDQVIEASGIRKQLEGLIRASSDDEFQQAFRESFKPALALKTVRKHFAKKLDEQALTEILAWHRSDAGRRITAAESVIDPDVKQKIEAYLDQESTPEIEKKLQLFEEIDRIGGVSEFEIRLADRMLRKLAEAVPADFPERAAVLEKIMGSLPSLDTVRKQNIAKSAYAFRDISPAELNEYLDFLKSPAGRKYNAASLDAVEEVFGKVIIKLGKVFRSNFTAHAKQR